MSKILFIDYDGTLHDTDTKIGNQFEGIYGLSSEEVIEHYVRVHLDIVHPQYPEKHDDFLFHQKLLYERLNRPYDHDEAQAMAKRFEDVHWSRWTNPLFFPDTLPFLDEVKEEHILCLTTGDYALEKAEALEKVSGKNYFSYVFDHTHLGIKGGNEFFSNALMSTNALPEDAVVIGDNPEQDIAAAKEIGILTIWVNRKGIPIDSLTVKPDYHINDLLEVPDILRIRRKPNGN